MNYVLATFFVIGMVAIIMGAGLLWGPGASLIVMGVFLVGASTLIVMAKE